MKSNLKICFFSENDFSGMVPRNHSNMRTEFAWICSLNAFHHQIHKVHEIRSNAFDIGIIIIPKNLDHLLNYSLINNLKSVCNKILFMQEGPNWHWQDYPTNTQEWFLNIIKNCDAVLTHNCSDLNYYSGLTNKKCFVMPSLIIEDNVKEIKKPERNNIIIGGNFCSWYGGHDSYIASQVLDCDKFSTSMGRMRNGEHGFNDLKHLPFSLWLEWMNHLNRFRYGIHLMRTHAAGTFALNCAYLGIPCVGYYGLDSQELCHPDLTIEVGNMVAAKDKLLKLQNDSDFYENCSLISKSNYQKHFAEQVYLLKMNDIFVSLFQ